MTDGKSGGDLATRVRERMAALNLNPYRTALKAGLGGSYVRDILRGRIKEPSGDKLSKLAVALEADVRYLLGQHQIGGHDPEPGVQHPPPAPFLATRESSEKEAVLLPIRYELMGNTLRATSDVVRAPLGFEAATIPSAYRGRDHWWELLRDDSMSPMIPRGALCQVVAMTDDERHLIGEGDIVVVMRRLLERESAIYNMAERSLRIVHYSYPLLGYWMMDFVNPDFQIVPDFFRKEDRPEPTTQEEREAIKAEVDRFVAGIRMDRLFDMFPEEEQQKILSGEPPPPETEEEAADSARRQREQEEFRQNKVMGKVIRILLPVDDRAHFGVGSARD